MKRSIFLSHSSVDKPFVEKLAIDLKKAGANVWYDKWEIKVGESITTKIEEGIRENEFLAIVLSSESVQSQWVRNELNAALFRQISSKKIIVLPILYRDCEIPILLADRKYADFRNDYSLGFEDLIQSIGMSKCNAVNVSNWRNYVNDKSNDWKKYRDKEFETLVTTLVDRAIDYNWSVWGGRSKNPYSLSIYDGDKMRKSVSISLRYNNGNYIYKACYNKENNPNNLKATDYDYYVGFTINECEEFIWRFMQDNRENHGDPKGGASYFVDKLIPPEDIMEIVYNINEKITNKSSWYKGNKLKITS